jgi:integrase
MAQKGSVWKKGSSWFLRYRDDFLIDGEIRRKPVCSFLAKYSDHYRRKSDLAELAEQKMAGVKQAAKCPHASDSFTVYVEEVYLPYVRRTMKPSTYAGYVGYWRRYLKPRVVKYALRDFSIAVVSSLLEDIAKMHSLNMDTIGKVRSILSGIFTYAMAKGNYPGRSAADNPASRALIPEAATKPKPTIAASRDEVKAILAHLAAEGLLLGRAAVALVAYTGVRPGECRGLRWEEWDRTAAQIKILRSVWHAVEGTTKTEQSNRYVTVTAELRAILLELWKSQGSPIAGYILARAKGDRVNLDNMSKREIAPALLRCAACKREESAEHKNHEFERDETLPRWHGWYSLRRFHGTQVRLKSGNSETMSKALGNSKEVADAHYNKPTKVLPDVRKAVNSAMRGLS